MRGEGAANTAVRVQSQAPNPAYSSEGEAAKLGKSAPQAPNPAHLSRDADTMSPEGRTATAATWQGNRGYAQDLGTVGGKNGGWQLTNE